VGGIVPLQISRDSESLTQHSFDSIRNTEFVPERTLIGLKYLRDKAIRERDLRELYRNRAFYELLQNADDAGATAALFALCSDGLAFAHNGRWFTVGNFRSLADGWSDKNPSECIGHKGLGFRSVLDITPCPHLIQLSASNSFFAVKFGFALNNGFIQQTLKEHSELRRQYDAWGKTGQRICPVMAIPGTARKESLGNGLTAVNRFVNKHADLKLTTMFWFPARDAELPRPAAEDLGVVPIISGEHGRARLLKFLYDEADIVLPFLSSIQQISLHEGDHYLGSAMLTVDNESSVTGVREICVKTDANGKVETRRFFQMSFASPIPAKIKQDANTPKAAKFLRTAGLRFAVRLSDGQPVAATESFFHVYFPTEQKTGFGFIVHGDFHVEPHRKYLVSGAYNSWLFGEAGRFAANDFLSALLSRYRPERVFSALAPVQSVATNDESFGAQFCRALRLRKAPFLPTAKGMRERAEVALAPTPEKASFWENYFSEVLPEICPGKTLFLSSEHDGQKVRSFLKLADVEVLAHDALIAMVEAAGNVERAAEWWYECYREIATDEKLALADRNLFAGRRLILTADGSVCSVPTEGGPLVCMPPDDGDNVPNVPKVFAKIFVFVNRPLALLLEQAPDTISSWVRHRFRISRFEASDLIPRAIRGVVQDVFDGSIPLTGTDLCRIWQFVKTLTESSGASFADEFWENIGRLPVPVNKPESEKPIATEQLAPAFLTYWPDSLLQEHNCLIGVAGLRRVDFDFLVALCGTIPGEDWIRFFQRAGISRSPKPLRYARIARGIEELPVSRDVVLMYERFTGERQHDENRAVALALRSESIWRKFVRDISDCGHDTQRVVQTLVLIEGLTPCCDLARSEHQGGGARWQSRLWNLVGSANWSEQSSDAVFCRGGRSGGHTVPAGSYLQMQLLNLRWLPSSAGPASLADCFLRRSTQRLILPTRAGDDLNDVLLPSVVVDDIDTFARLQRLGVIPLEDTQSATSVALVRALCEIGNRMSDEECFTYVTGASARWRSVRAAIQDIYRTLNQRQDYVTTVPGLKIAIKTRNGIRIDKPPLYYAEPGPLRDAFVEVLPLIDADRNFPQFFQKLVVQQLTVAETVEERLIMAGEAHAGTVLRQQVIDGLAPYYLALMRAKFDLSGQDEDLISRRLKERFEVLIAPQLQIEFSLSSNRRLALYTCA
jgi:hypothetical protein